MNVVSLFSLGLFLPWQLNLYECSLLLFLLSSPPLLMSRACVCAHLFYLNYYIGGEYCRKHLQRCSTHKQVVRATCMCGDGVYLCCAVYCCRAMAERFVMWFGSGCHTYNIYCTTTDTIRRAA